MPPTPAPPAPPATLPVASSVASEPLTKGRKK